MGTLHFKDKKHVNANSTNSHAAGTSLVLHQSNLRYSHNPWFWTFHNKINADSKSTLVDCVTWVARIQAGETVYKIHRNEYAVIVIQSYPHAQVCQSVAASGSTSENFPGMAPLCWAAQSLRVFEKGRVYSIMCTISSLTLRRFLVRYFFTSINVAFLHVGWVKLPVWIGIQMWSSLQFFQKLWHFNVRVEKVGWLVRSWALVVRGNPCYFTVYAAWHLQTPWCLGLPVAMLSADIILSDWSWISYTTWFGCIIFSITYYMHDLLDDMLHGL